MNLIQSCPTIPSPTRIYTEVELGILESALQKRAQQIKLEINQSQKKLNIFKNINHLRNDWDRVNRQLLEITTQRNRLLVAKKFRNSF